MNLRKDHYRFSWSFHALWKRNKLRVRDFGRALGPRARLLLATNGGADLGAVKAPWIPPAGPGVGCGAPLQQPLENIDRRKDPRPSPGFIPRAPRVGMCEKLLCCIFLTCALKRDKLKKQHCTVDHLARGSMKNAANCASECELQDT